MYIPETFLAALLLIIISMLCWGSWPNLLKAVPHWRLEYFYLDYTFGGVLIAILLASTMGARGWIGLDFIQRLHESGGRAVISAFLGGLVWNVGNILLLNGIMIAGLSVAFPVASALAIILGVGVGYVAQPVGNPIWLFGAVVVLVAAGYTNAAAYRDLSQSSGSKSKGIMISLLAGVLIGGFPPLVGRAISGPHPLDSYNVSICFALGAMLASVLGLPLLVSRPLIGTPNSMKGYLKGSAGCHLLGLIAGAIWGIGTVSNFTSAGIVGVAISWGIGSGAPIIGALWGIFLWREFKNSDFRAKALIGASMGLYIVGVVIVAISYQVR